MGSRPWNQAMKWSPAVPGLPPEASHLLPLGCRNYPADVPGGTKLWKFGMDQVYLPFYKALMVKDAGLFQDAGRSPPSVAKPSRGNCPFGKRNLAGWTSILGRGSAFSDLDQIC